jgi:hypothetical protein
MREAIRDNEDRYSATVLQLGTTVCADLPGFIHIMDITTSSIIVANTFPRLCHAQHGASTTIPMFRVTSPDWVTVTSSSFCAESLSSMNFPVNIKKAEQTERTVHIKEPPLTWSGPN